MTHLSNVFKYISYFRHAGHQVGRKVGDMLEVLTYAALERDSELFSRLHVEPKLFGFSDAGHKVEFVVWSEKKQLQKGGEIKDPGKVIGFIECKKVGVEQTINGGFKKKFRKNGSEKNYLIPFNEEFFVTFAPRDEQKHVYSLTFTDDKKIHIGKVDDPKFSIEETVNNYDRIIFALCEDNNSVVLTNSMSLRDFDKTLKNCRILDISGFNNQGALAILNDCLAGPQTPEKAKQSSFVALDLRKKRFNSFDKRADESEMLSILVITEFSHWENKSQNMIKACIDKNLVVDDAIIIEAFQKFEDAFGENFYDKITKDSFENDSDVKKIALAIVNQHDGKIFKDIEDGELKKIAIIDGKLKVIS